MFFFFLLGADIDSQDNRKVSCLMAAFRKGHSKVVKWLVKHVTQFPSDTELNRFIATISDKVRLSQLFLFTINLIRNGINTEVVTNKHSTWKCF
jgi:ankyrin repeat domain-containing protein 17